MVKFTFFPIALKNRFPKDFKKLFLYFYIFGIVSGLLLLFLYGFFHSMVFCSSLLGEKVCTPTGIFVIIVLSLPGYLIAGNILAFITELPWVISLLVVVVTSGSFYFLFGVVIDRARGKKLTAKELNKIIIITSFLILLLLLFSLLNNIKGQ